MKAQAKFYRPVQYSLVLIAYANSESLKNKGCRWRLRLNFRPSSLKISHMRVANDLARLHICAVSPEPRLVALKRRDVNEGLGQIVDTSSLRFLSRKRAAKDQASLHIRTVSPENVWIFIFLWVTRCVINLREKWEKNLPWWLCLRRMHKSKTEIRPASNVTTVVGSIYCDKIVHTKKKLLSTTWQTCINA